MNNKYFHLIVTSSTTDMKSFMQVNAVFQEKFIEIEIWKKKLMLEYPQYFKIKKESNDNTKYEEVYYDVSIFAPKNSNKCRPWY